MAMMKVIPAANPDAYVDALHGWRRAYVEALRAATMDTCPFKEVIKWGHLVYYSNGPVLLIRAEEHRVLFGFWRGKHLRTIEPRLKHSGMYEMATLALSETTPLARATVVALVQRAFALNAEYGDPTAPASSRILSM